MLGDAMPKHLSLCIVVYASIAGAIPSTAPHNYPGMPAGDYSPEWQSCEPRGCSLVRFRHSRHPPDFQVTTPLPGVDFDLGTNYAGNIGVRRPGHPDNSLFFWGFEHTNGSLTASPGAQDDVPWAIWLQGGYDRITRSRVFFLTAI